MEIKIREYKNSDFNELLKANENLIDHMIKLDKLKRIRRLPSYGKSYTKNLLLKVKKNDGIIFVAEYNKKFIGFIAGFIEKQSKEELLECIPTKIGKVEDLFVYSEYRSKNLGKILMKNIESYFKKKKCDVIRLHVFALNSRAHEFYKRLLYHDRQISMLKRIK